MSTELEDSAFEEALRRDLPSDEVAARVRRRLVAAGLAIGNGVAATSAAAAGVGPSAVAGASVKVASLSWGIKLGIAAAIAIPTVGLLVESKQAQRAPAPRSVQRATPPAAGSMQAFAPRVALDAKPASALAAPSMARAAATHAEKLPVGGKAMPTATNAPMTTEVPSRASFEAADVAVTTATPGKTSSTLAEETRLLDAAFAALSAGERARAAELVREHEARFPRGLLVRERERARVRLNEITRGQ